MNVAISQLVLPREWSLEETAQNVKEAGFDAIELILTADGELGIDRSAEELREAADLVRRAGVEPVSVCPALGEKRPSMTVADPEERAEAVEGWKRIIDAVAAMGIDTVLVVPGAVTEEVAYDEAYYRAQECLRKLAPYADAKGVNLAVEYVWNKMLLSPMEMRRFLDEIGHPRVGFYFDTGNMVIFGYPEQWARIVGPHIMKVHVKDFRRSDQSWPGLLEGDVNFEAVMRELRRIGYDDALISEVSPSAQPLEQQAEAIRKIMAL